MRRGALGAGLAIAGLLALAGAATGERQLDGNLLVAFDGGIEPKQLPRERAAPVSVGVAGDFRTTDGTDPPPQLHTLTIGINREGRIFDRGLPTCTAGRIQPGTRRAALRLCGDALVGDGRVAVRVKLPNQRPFDFHGPLLVFNAPSGGGERRLIAQIYGLKPPSSFALAFRVKRRPGTFGTVIRTRLPRVARRWAYLTHFEMNLHRTYTWRGEQRSFVNASCAAPAGFPGALFPFAKAVFGFANGQRVSQTLIRSCTVR